MQTGGGATGPRADRARGATEGPRRESDGAEGVAAAPRERSTDEDVAHLADTFQLLANPTRLRIVEALARRELCVCDLAEVVESSPSSVSHHLRQLRQMRLVRHRKEGRKAYYRLDDEHVTELFRTGLEHVRE